MSVKRTGTVLLVRCAYMFVVCATEDSENYPRIETFVCVKIPIKLIEKSMLPVPASSRACPLPQGITTSFECVALLWERVYPRRGRHRSTPGNDKGHPKVASVRVGGVAVLLLDFPASQLGQGLADVSQGTHGLHTSVLQGGELLVRSALAAGDDGASVAHALARRCGNTGDVGNDRLGDVGLDVGSSFFFSRTADLTDHDDRFGLRVFLEQLQDVDEVGARDRVTTDADAGRLAEAGVGGLLHSFVGQGAGTRNDTDLAWQVDMAWHDADLALARGDDTWAVRADQGHAQLVALDLGIQHVQGRNAFGDAHDQLDAAEGSFQDRVLAERSRNVDDRSVSAGSFHSFFHGVEHWQAQVGGATLAWGYAADHLGAVGDGLFGVESTLRAGEALADDFGVFIDQDAHYLPSAALTTC
ncbi:exported protein of unknown function [Pseudomonas sp. JV551A1]|uniref:Uncharacterized protein n=1 Tax=Pseudomonas inefficax TaxID=2078786 RepID=A0AAQ1SVB1_9PSED|nr:exported protein of unknown function [Pseudomonas sp. JV551A1]SPO62653.1 exported protein of unknown function [Pseudomonas inefficax]